jgi:protein-tyrosine-phosphatase
VANQGKVLFLCSGNTCRSPMAAALLHKYLAERYPEVSEQLEVDSAGVHTISGLPASDGAVEVMREEGLDLTGHQSRRATEETIREASLVLAMTVGIKQDIVRRHPWAGDKVFTLKEFVDDDAYADVVDPFGGDIEVYSASYREIKALVLRSLDRIVELAGGNDVG